MPHVCCVAGRAALNRLEDLGQASENEFNAAHGGDFASPGTAKHYAPHLTLEPIHLQIDVNVDLEKHVVLGEVTTTIKCNAAGPKSRSLTFNAVQFSQVKEVVDVEGGDNSSVETWRYDGEVIEVTWKTAFTRGEQRKLKITYEVVKPISGLLFSNYTERYPNLSRFVATDHETERARYWLPCVDNPAIRTTVDFIIRARKEYIIVAGGLPLSDNPETEHDDGTKTSRWSLTARTPSYLISFAVGDFVRVDEEPVDGVPIAYFVVRSTPRGTYTEEDLRTSFGKTPAIMRWMTAKLATPFPFQKYYQIVVPGIGGAMENITLTTWDESIFADKVYASEIQDTTIDPIIVHEMAHSYFGDLLVMRHFEHAWLKESWATFMEMMWLEDTVSKDEFEYELLCAAQRYFSECESYVRPIVTRQYNVSWDLFDAHLYPGGAWRLQMLRKLLTDEVFWPAITDYISKYASDLVDTDDFKKVLERHSSLNLTAFFEEWVYGKGFPKLKGSFAYSAEKKEATVTLDQTQKDEKKGIEIFRVLDVEVEVTDEQGSKHTGTISFDAKGNGSYTFKSLTSKVSRIRLDPDHKVLFSLEFNPGEDIVANTLLKAEDIYTRIRSLNELIKIGSLAALEKVNAALEKEPFWGVRYQATSFLARAKTHITLPFSVKILERETVHKARNLMLLNYKFKDTIIKDTIREVLKKDLAYRSRARALEILGLQADSSDQQFIESFAKDTSYQLIVAGGSYRALGGQRTLEAYQALKSALENKETSIVLYPAILSGISSVVAWLPDYVKKDAINISVEHLRSPFKEVRYAAVSALVSLGATETARQIAALKSTFPSQEHPWLERQVNGLKRTGDDNVAKLKTELGEIESRLKQLEEKAAKAATTTTTPATTIGQTTTTTTATPTSPATTPVTEPLPPVSQATQVELHPEGTQPTSDDSK